MTESTERVNETFLNYFRRKKGIYSQEDVEKIVAEAKLEWQSQLRKEIEGLESHNFVSQAKDHRWEDNDYFKKYDVLNLLQETK